MDDNNLGQGIHRIRVLTNEADDLVSNVNNSERADFKLRKALIESIILLCRVVYIKE